MLRALAVALVLTVVAATTGDAHFRRHGHYCGAIVFTPRSDDASSDIRATRVKCRNARRIVKAWERGNRNPLHFHCRAREHDGANLAHDDVVCTRANRRVTWAAY